MTRSVALALALFAATCVFSAGVAQAATVEGNSYDVTGTVTFPRPPFIRQFEGTFSFASDGTLTLETPQGTFPGFWDDNTVGAVTTVFFAVNFNGNVFVGSATEINGQIAGSANIPLLGATVTFSGEVAEAAG